MYVGNDSRSGDVECCSAKLDCNSALQLARIYGPEVWFMIVDRGRTSHRTRESVSLRIDGEQVEKSVRGIYAVSLFFCKLKRKIYWTVSKLQANIFRRT